ncbi:LysR family transcriptional regulator [Pseudoduganella sp. LjRoot289]|uniref:LysR family transcriptional regulator n=1 Tax=Pseudoduganella sp. LjRoot289 TaxID=3342314 RepID=UPI003ECC325E
MTRHIDLRLLRTLLAVAESGNMSAAANRLHMTQGAVSQQIKRLEALFGQALLERNAHGSKVTEAGERVLSQAGQLLALNDSLLADAVQDAADKVRLGVPYDLAGAFIVPVLKAHAEQFPDVAVELVSGSSKELADAYRSGEVDLAVVEGPHGTLGGSHLSLQALVWSSDGQAHLQRPLPLCFVSPSCVFRPAVFSALADHGIEYKVVFDNASIEATSATVRSGLATAVWLAGAVPPGLAVLGADAGLPALPSFAIALLGPARHQRPAVASLAQAVTLHHAAATLGAAAP